MVFIVGQIINFRYEDRFSTAISTILGHYWTHTAIVVKVDPDGGIYLMEAIGNAKGKEKSLKSVIKNIFSKSTQDIVISKYSRDFLSNMHKTNKIKIMDFKFAVDNDFSDFITINKNKTYDYLGAFKLFLKRLFYFFGKEYSNDIKTTEKLICSELAARLLDKMTDFNILKLANKKTYEEITPQDISLIYDKLKLHYMI